MVHVQSSIEIQASLAEVFRLLCEPARKTRLNPEVEVIHAELVTPGPMAVGSRIYYNLRVPGGIRSFHCEVTAYEHNRSVEWLSDTRPSFRVRQSLEPTASGCRLVHDEWLAVAAPAAAKPRRWSLAEITQAFRQAAGLGMPGVPALIGEPLEEMRAAMQNSLAVWLGNIRRHLEVARGEAGIEFDPASTVAF